MKGTICLAPETVELLTRFALQYMDLADLDVITPAEEKIFRRRIVTLRTKHKLKDPALAIPAEP